jgi:hypothetical protein
MIRRVVLTWRSSATRGVHGTDEFPHGDAGHDYVPVRTKSSLMSTRRCVNRFGAAGSKGPGRSAGRDRQCHSEYRE